MEIQIDLLHKRRIFFADNFPAIPDRKGGTHNNLKNTCPACGYVLLTERAGYEICPLCHWEDDGQDDATADEVWGGPNQDFSLSRYRLRFFEELIALPKKNEFKNSKEEQFAKALATMLEEEHHFFEKGDNKDQYLASIKNAIALADTHFPDTIKHTQF